MVWNAKRIARLEKELRYFARTTGTLRDDEVLHETLTSLPSFASVAEEVNTWLATRARTSRTKRGKVFRIVRQGPSLRESVTLGNKPIRELDIVLDKLDRMLDTLSDREEFWTKYPVPSISVSDSTFDGTGRWKGTRKNCPWNGRVWPVINTHILEGLTYWAERGNKRAAKLATELLKKTVTMLSGACEGVDMANSFEHYHPETGVGSRYLAQAIEPSVPKGRFLDALKALKVTVRGPKPASVMRARRAWSQRCQSGSCSH